MEGSDLAQVKDVVLGFLASGIGIWIVSELHAVRTSIENLNLKLAKVLAENEYHEQRISRLEKLLEKIH